MHGMIALEYLFLWFLLYAFVGWVYESILVSISEHRWVNRGFLNGPLCPIYGCGAVLAIVLLHDLHNPVVIFFFRRLAHARSNTLPLGVWKSCSTPDGGTTATTGSTSRGESAYWEPWCSALRA